MTLSWDPLTDTWTELAPPPLAHRWGAAVSWTGNELIMWGGSSFGGMGGPTFADGAAFQPDSATVPSTQSTTAAPGTTSPLESDAPSASSAASTSADVPLPTTVATGGVDGPVVYAAVSDFAEQALGAGTVELAGQCLLLRGALDGGSRRPVIVWQFGTSWSDDDSEVILPDGTAVPIGSMISAGGGFHGADQLDEFLSSPEALERISDCVEYDSTDNVFVIQSLVEVVS